MESYPNDGGEEEWPDDDNDEYEFWPDDDGGEQIMADAGETTQAEALAKQLNYSKDKSFVFVTIDDVQKLLPKKL